MTSPVPVDVRERVLARKAVFDALVSADWYVQTEIQHAIADAVLAAVDPVIRGQDRAATAEKIAYDIRAELVCCDIYEKDHGTDRAGKKHAICFWGEAGARIAEEHRPPPLLLVPRPRPRRREMPADDMRDLMRRALFDDLGLDTEGADIAIEAIEPLVRRQAAKEIAEDIANRIDERSAEVYRGDGIHNDWDAGLVREGLDDAAAITRSHSPKDADHE